MSAFDKVTNYFTVLEAKVFGKLAIGYHRTRNLKNVKAIGDSGFSSGKGAFYGPGIYLTYDFDSQLNDLMKTTYGPYIIRSKVNLEGFLIFDADVAKVVYGAKYKIMYQLEKFKIKITDRNTTLINAHTLTTHIANYDADPATFALNPFTSSLARSLFKFGLIENKGIKGLVFTGQRDGKVIVSYDSHNVVPFGYARVIDNNKQLEKVKWNPLSPTGALEQAKKKSEEVIVDKLTAITTFLRKQGCVLMERTPITVDLFHEKSGLILHIYITSIKDNKFLTEKIFVGKSTMSLEEVKNKYKQGRGDTAMSISHTLYEIRNIIDLEKFPAMWKTWVEEGKNFEKRKEKNIEFLEEFFEYITKPGSNKGYEIIPYGVGTGIGDTLFGSLICVNRSQTDTSPEKFSIHIPRPYLELGILKIKIAVTYKKDGVSRLGLLAASCNDSNGVKQAYQTFLNTLQQSLKDFRYLDKNAISFPSFIKPSVVADILELSKEPLR